VHGAVRVSTGQKVILRDNRDRCPFSVVATKRLFGEGVGPPHGIRRLAGDLLVYALWTRTKSDFSRRDYSPCFGGSSYQTEMAITATLRFTGLPVR
jgi:hypothetical protein